MEFVTNFSQVTGSRLAKIRAMSSGDTGSGKSRLAFSMPRQNRIGIFPLEPNCRTSLDRIIVMEPDPESVYLIPQFNFMHLDLPENITDPDWFEQYYDRRCKELQAAAANEKKTYYQPNKDDMRQALDEKNIRTYYLGLWNDIKSIGRVFSNKKISSALIDSGTELYDIVCLALLGRRPRFGDKAADLSVIHYELRMFMNLFKDSNLLITHHEKAEFRSFDNVAKPTGMMIHDGWKRLGYNMDLYIEHIKIDNDDKLRYVKTKFHRKDAKLTDYAAIVRKSTARPMLVGAKDGSGVLLNHEISFAQLINRVWPNTDLIDDWGYTEEEVLRFVTAAEEYYQAELEL